MQRYIIAISCAAILLIFAMPSCRRPDTADTVRENIKPSPAITKLQFIEDLRVALQREDLVLRQFMEHAKKFELSWPYSHAIKAARLRIMKIESIFFDNNLRPGFVRHPTEQADSIEEALKMDAELLSQLVKLYEDMTQKNFEEINPRLVRLLLRDVSRSWRMIENHDGVPPDELKEYGEKKFRPRQK